MKKVEVNMRKETVDRKMLTKCNFGFFLAFLKNRIISKRDGIIRNEMNGRETRDERVDQVCRDRQSGSRR